MNEVKTTTTCDFCNGFYYRKGWCPKYGLKFNNSFCKEVTVKYKTVKVRNSNPWYKFWNLYEHQQIILP